MSWRTNNQTQLLLSFIEPHKEISSSTIARWIKTTLRLAGVNEIGLFSAHSTRSASTSRAGFSGLSVDDILHRGSWSNESIWQRFYHKTIIQPEQRFQEKVLTRK